MDDNSTCEIEKKTTQLQQDTMTVYRTYGNPNLFITFTCNLNCHEIQITLKKKRNYKHEDKQDIISYLFRVKLNDMLFYIKSRKPFRNTIASKLLSIPF